MRVTLLPNTASSGVISITGKPGWDTVTMVTRALFVVVIVSRELALCLAFKFTEVILQQIVRNELSDLE